MVSSAFSRYTSSTDHICILHFADSSGSSDDDDDSEDGEDEEEESESDEIGSSQELDGKYMSMLSCKLKGTNDNADDESLRSGNGSSLEVDLDSTGNPVETSDNEAEKLKYWSKSVQVRLFESVTISFRYLQFELASGLPARTSPSFQGAFPGR